MSHALLPSRIVTERTVLRAWTPSDAPALKAAIDASLDHLRPWMPWAEHEPSPVASIAERLERFGAEFREDRDWIYGVFTLDERTVLGGCGLHARGEPGSLEIGYWLVAGQTGKGLATEVARALTTAAFGRPGIRWVEIRCDPRNVASAGVPRRLGFSLVTTLGGNTRDPMGAARDTMVWQFRRGQLARSSRDG